MPTYWPARSVRLRSACGPAPQCGPRRRAWSPHMPSWACSARYFSGTAERRRPLTAGRPGGAPSRHVCPHHRTSRRGRGRHGYAAAVPPVSMAQFSRARMRSPTLASFSSRPRITSPAGRHPAVTRSACYGSHGTARRLQRCRRSSAARPARRGSQRGTDAPRPVHLCLRAVPMRPRSLYSANTLPGRLRVAEGSPRRSHVSSNRNTSGSCQIAVPAGEHPHRPTGLRAGELLGVPCQQTFAPVLAAAR